MEWFELLIDLLFALIPLILLLVPALLIIGILWRIFKKLK